MSKGSKQRPIKDRKKFNKNYDEIFGQKDKKDKSQDNYTTKEIIEAMDRINARH